MANFVSRRAGTVLHVCLELPFEPALIGFLDSGVACALFQEFMKKASQSLSAYSKGVDVAVRYLGADHGITTTLKRSQAAAQAALDNAARKRKPSAATATGTSECCQRRCVCFMPSAPCAL